MQVEHSLEQTKKIIHVDMDSFFAAIEIRDAPELAAKPIAVAGDPDKRGVVATSNYIAREYGVYSAMPTMQALRLCPDLVLIKPNITKYKDVSIKIQNIFKRFTNEVEPLSLDEAFLDVTDCKGFSGSATLIAKEIQQTIFAEQQLTASAGVAPNKFLAKVASDWNKPNGLFVIAPAQVADFVAGLPVNKIIGVGPVMENKLTDLGILTCCDLQRYSLLQLQEFFGKIGSRLYYFSRGIDVREVETSYQRKSLSVEETFAKDLHDKLAYSQPFKEIINELSNRISRVEERQIHKLFVKLKFSNFVGTTVERSCGELDMSVFEELLDVGIARGNSESIRLLGAGVRFAELKAANWVQLTLPGLA